MKIAVVYTGTTPELIETVETEIKRALGDTVELYTASDPTILVGGAGSGRRYGWGCLPPDIHVYGSRTRRSRRDSQRLLVGGRGGGQRTGPGKIYRRSHRAD